LANNQPAPTGHFNTTLWSVVLQAGSDETRQARPALEQLCRAYSHPLYSYVRRRGHTAHDAQDLVQGLFADLIAGNAFQNVSPDQGRFRAFLLAAMNHYLAGDTIAAVRPNVAVGRRCCRLTHWMPNLVSCKSPQAA